MKLFYSDKAIDYETDRINDFPNTHNFDFSNDDDINNAIGILALTHCHLCEYDNESNYRDAKAFKAGYGVVLDFDNKAGHAESSLEDYRSSSFASKYNWVAYTSKSHTPETPSFHLIIPINEPITTLSDYEAFVRYTKDCLRDEGCVMDNANIRMVLNPSRASGCVEPNEYFECDWNNTNEMWAWSPSLVRAYNQVNSSYKRERSDYIPSMGNFSTKLDSTLDVASDRHIWNILKQFANYMNKESFNISYADWSLVAKVFNSYFDYDSALGLFKIMSVGWKDQDEKYVADNFHKIITNDDKYYGISYIDKIATRCKFNFRMTIKHYLKLEQKSNKVSHNMKESLMDDRNNQYDIVFSELCKASDTKKARSFAMRDIDSDGNESFRKISVSDFKDMYGDFNNVERFAWTAEASNYIRKVTRFKSGDPQMDHIINDCIISLDKGYLTPKDITKARLTIREGASKHRYQSHYSKKAVVAKLFSFGLIQYDTSTRENIDGRDIKIYRGVK